MKNLNLVKTLYESYPYIIKLVPVMDKKILAMGLSSGNIGGYNPYEVCELANAMLDMIDRKKELQNIKKVIDCVIRNLPKKSAKVIVSFYMQDMALGEIAKQEKTTYARMRTRYNNALMESMCLFDKFGYNENRIMDMMNKEKWMRNIYKEKEMRSNTNNKVLLESMKEEMTLEDNQKSNSSFATFLGL